MWFINPSSELIRAPSASAGLFRESMLNLRNDPSLALQARFSRGDSYVILESELSAMTSFMLPLRNPRRSTATYL